jgi:hypothetical protein
MSTTITPSTAATKSGFTRYKPADECAICHHRKSGCMYVGAVGAPNAVICLRIESPKPIKGGMGWVHQLPPAKGKGHGKGSAKRIVATYGYTDAAGVLLYEVVRYEPKDFLQRRPDGQGGYVWKMEGVDRVLYRLPDLVAASDDSIIWIAEGEKDVDNLRSAGLIATCNAAGAGKWGTLSDDSILTGHHICIIADKDEPGRPHAQDVAGRLHGRAASIKIIEVPGNACKDASDFLSAGGDAEQLSQLWENAPEWTPESKPPPQQPDGSEPVLMRMSDIARTEILWLWPGRFPLGKISVLASRPGDGKTFIACDLAARVSTGRGHVDGTEIMQGSVLLICAEDDPSDTLGPRLDNHHADSHKIHLLRAVNRTIDGKINEVMFTLEDVASLEKALVSINDCRLIIIDPIGSFLGADADAHRDNEVRAVLAPLAMLAERYKVAVLIIAHIRKASGGHADDLVLGSRAFTGLARAVWHVTRDPDNKHRRLMLPGKSNIAKESTGLAFTIEDPGCVCWEPAPVDQNADEALALSQGTTGPEPEARKAAAEWLIELLAFGPIASADVQQAARDARLGWRAVRRAAESLGIKARKAEFGGPWQWHLPPKMATSPEGGHLRPDVDN